MIENNPTSTEERSKRVRYIREEILRLSRAKFSERTGISPNSLQNWEQGRNENTGVPEKSAKRLLQAFKKEGVDCSLEWLLYGIGNPPSSLFSHSTITPLKMQDEESIIKEELTLFHTLNHNTIDAVVNDDAMSPYFWPGDIVAGKYYEGDAIKKALGLPCIVQTKTGGVFVRLLEEGENTDVYNLSCSNAQSIAKILMKNINLIKAAPILWIRKKSRIF